MGGQLLLFISIFALLVNTGYTDPVGTCPDRNDAYVTFLTDNEDCSIFYKCESGVPYKYDCPSDLYFNPILNVCDYPEQTDCGYTQGGNENSNEDDGTNGNDGGSWVGECPQGNDNEEADYITLLPHESDCTLYYECVNGNPVLQKCANDMYFNSIMVMCDSAENSGCSNLDDGGDSSESGENGNGAVGECPADNDGDAVHLPHESDCTLFYKCDWGVPVLKECPDDLHFNPTLQVCDFPERAGCESGTGDNGNGNGDGGDGEGNGNGQEDESSESSENGNGAVGECPADNDGDAVHLPHESDCTLFYKCDWGVPVLKECPDDLHFNPTLQVCDFPERAGCESGTGDNGNGDGGDGDDNESGEEEDDNSESSENGNGAVGECPADNDGDAVHLPHESDCTLFYKCDWGVPVLKECPDDLHFNPTLQVCDFPERAGCESGTGDNGNGNGDGGDGEGNGNGEEDESSESSENGNGAVGECPADNDGDAVHLPHESDCTLFYKCDWGVPVLKECPDDLHFNPTLQVCDFPERAGCESGTGDNGNGDGGDGDDNESGEEEDDNSESSENGNGAVGECPADNDGDAVHLPHESDCTLFYKCDWGVPVLKECPDDLHFNPTLQVCDFPERAGCESGTGDNGNGNGDGGDGEGNGNGQEDESSESSENGNGAVGECPADNDGDAVHLPHESDCTLFYKCDWGVPVLKECPDDLHFNPTLQVCDFPERAGCESGTGDNGNGNGDGGDGEGNGNGQEDESSESSENGNGAVGECPADNDGDAVHLPHESDCTLFYKCDWGVPVLKECPDDLHFNPTLQVCDFPERAGCESGTGDNGNGDGGDGDDNESGEEEDDNSESSENGNGAVGECPADNDGDAVHLPHESDCTLFYKCDWGVPVLKECPDDLHFNPTLQVCDFPERAGCESGTGDNGNGNGDGGDGEGNGNGEEDESSESSENGNGAVGECPADNDGDAVHLPHESDCTLFYKCDWGVPVLKECPDDLHFNPTLQVCDFPERAGCESGTGDNGNGDGGDGDDNESGEEEDDNSESSENGNGAVGECPADNDGDAVHLPHESDCTLFYKCDWGVPVLKECPDDLHFNPTLQVCDFPERGGCESGTGDNGNGNGDGGDGEGNGNGEEEDDSSESSENGNGAVGECPADNDGDAVHLPHESDCTLFYKCDWGVPVLKECPDDLHFNPTLQVCDFPERAGCESGTGDNGNGNGDGGDGEGNGNGEEEDDSSESSENGNGAVGECPADNDGDAVHLPHESDCTLFYKCDWGVPVLKECPDDLHFNPTLQVCDFPERAGCESGTGDNGNGNGDGEDGEGNGNGEEEDDSSESSENGNGAVGECPADNDGDAVHLPHESDCTLFYKCDWGVPVLKECPDDLHFNPTLHVCDFPERAGCESGTGDNGNGNGDGGDGEGNGNGEEEDDSSESSENGNGAVGECPADNDGDAVHLPHESDCTLFYKCDWGVPVLKECPDDLHFNPTLQVCDFPERAGCESGTGDNGNGNGDGGDGEGNGNGKEEDDSSESSENGNGAVGECPADNDGDAVHLPHESDCTLFYKCDWGVPVLKECPDDLHFNPTLQVCDFPERAGCESGTGDNGNGDGGDGEDNGNGEEEDDSSESSENGNGAVGECPADNDGDAVHLPHESDCTLFYKCDWGVPVLKECPDDLHFNPTLQVCDFPERAGCESGTGDNGNGNGDGGDGEGNGNGEEEDDSSESSENGNGAVGECPAANDGYAVHLPHESDCTLFYKCDWGVPVLKECPDDLHFNPTLQVCDFAENAGCESGTESSVGGDGGDDDDNSDGGSDNENDNNESSSFCDSISCPAENEQYVTFIPNTSDCTRFCKCDWGLAYEFVCSAGLYFNPTLNVCDFPENSGCTM